MHPPVEPLSQARRRRAARAGEAALAIVLLLRLASGLLAAVGGPTREERARRPAPHALRLGTATREELQWLPGMGPARAAAVEMARPDGSVPWTWEDVLRVPGIGPVTLARWKRLAGVSP